MKKSIIYSIFLGIFTIIVGCYYFLKPVMVLGIKFSKGDIIYSISESNLNVDGYSLYIFNTMLYDDFIKIKGSITQDMNEANDWEMIEWSKGTPNLTDIKFFEFAFGFNDETQEKYKNIIFGENVFYTYAYRLRGEGNIGDIILYIYDKNNNTLYEAIYNI